MVYAHLPRADMKRTSRTLLLTMAQQLQCLSQKSRDSTSELCSTASHTDNIVKILKL